MMKKFFIIVFLLGALSITGCRYNFIVPEEVPVIDPDDPSQEVLFSEDILPIFTNNNNCTSCHKTGGQMPDLTAGNAYSAINSSRYINPDSPDQSRIYTVAHPDNEGHSQKKYTATEAALVLAWIQQGAENN